MSASKIVCHVGPAKDDKGEIIVSTKSGGHGTSTVSFKLLKAEKIGKMAAVCKHSSSNTSLSVNHQRNSRMTTQWHKYRQSSSVLLILFCPVLLYKLYSSSVRYYYFVCV